jgi:hypothetical protein
MSISKLKPSEVVDEYWLRVINQDADYFDKDPERSGKWLVFLPKGEKLDTAWQKIEQAVLDGKLGESAKVSTMKPNPNAVNNSDGVICVYTYSLDDLDDVRRIRKELRQMGITWKIPYKLDKDVGRYSNQGETKLSKLYE